MVEIVYLNGMATKTERLQIVLSPDDLAKLDEWRRQQTDLPNRSEAIRRLIGVTKNSTDWEELLTNAPAVDVSNLGQGRINHLLSKAIERALMAMSNDEHPAWSDITELYSIWLDWYPQSARVKVGSALAFEAYKKEMKIK